MANIPVVNPDGSESQFDTSQIKPVQKRSNLEAIKDTLLHTASGGVGSTKAATDAFGANNPVSKTLGDVSSGIHAGLSDSAKADQQIAAQRIQQAEGKGAMAEIGATLKNIYESPAATTAEAAGSLVPTVATMAATKGRNPKVAAGVMGAAQGAGAVKGGIYEAVKQNALENGYDEANAELIAREAQAYTGENKDQIALGAGLGVLASTTGAESSKLLSGAGKKGTDLFKETLKGFTTEGVTEAAQGGQERVASNVALQRQGEDVPTWQGVAGQATQEGVAGGLVGGGVSAVDTLTDIRNPREQLRDDLLAQEPEGAITQAAATAAMTGAADDSIAEQQLLKQTEAFDAELAGVVEAMRNRNALNDARGVVDDAYMKDMLYALNIARNPETPLNLRQRALDAVKTAVGQDFRLAGDVEVTSETFPEREIQLPEVYNGRTGNQAGATQASTQGRQKRQNNAQTSSGDSLSQSAAARLGDLARTLKSSSGSPVSDAGASDNPVTYVIRNKETGEVTRETYDPNEINYFKNTVELVEKKQHEQDLENGLFAEPTPEGVAYNGALEPNRSQEGDLLARVGAPNNQVDSSANQAATSPLNELPEPTQAQKEAGNYKVGRVRINGLDVSIENPDQSTRSGVDSDGNTWQSTMNGHYGYVKGVVARAPDKEHVDVNIKPNTDENFSGQVFVINQNDPSTGKFDEPKVYIGYESEQAARDAYMSNYEEGWQGLDSIVPVSMERFKSLLNRKDGFMKPIKPTMLEQRAQRKAVPNITEEETEHLFGLKTKREKALKRIAAGRGWFGKQSKANEFVRVNGLSETHEVQKGERGRWDIVEKSKPNQEANPLNVIDNSENDVSDLNNDQESAPQIRAEDVKVGDVVEFTGPALRGDIQEGDTATVIARPTPNSVRMQTPSGGQFNMSNDTLNGDFDEPNFKVIDRQEVAENTPQQPQQTPRMEDKVQVITVGDNKPKVKSSAPEHASVGVDERELDEIVSSFNKAQREAVEDGEKLHHLFDTPAKGEIVRLQNKVKVYNKDFGWMTPDEAKQVIEGWKQHADDQYADGEQRSYNNQKVVLSLFDLTGKWSEPWERAGYQVFRFDIQEESMVEHFGEEINTGDINNFGTEFFNDIYGSFDGLDIHAVLAACPCTDFAVSGARHFAAKDKDGRTVASVNLVHQTLATIEHFKPAVWAIENPVGRIEKLGGLPPWRLSFDPNHLGEDYTKKTLLWGRFNADLPIAPTEATAGSKMHTQYGGKSLATKNARSATPEGFAYSFFMANNAIDHPVMTIANKYDRLDRELIEKAVNAGVSEADIDEAVAEYYYMELDDTAANEAIAKLIEGQNVETIDQDAPNYVKNEGVKETQPTLPELKAIRDNLVDIQSKNGMFGDARIDEEIQRLNDAINAQESDNAATAQPETVSARSETGDTQPKRARSSNRKPLASRVASDGQGATDEQSVQGSLLESSDEGTPSTRGSAEQSESSNGQREAGNAGSVSDAASTELDDNFTITDDVELGKGGLAKKFRDNVDAIRIIKTLEEENRKATPEERGKLAKYVGFGALKGAFDRENKQWAKQYRELKDLLTEEEYQAALRSTLDAHYTAKPVVNGMYSAIERLGFKAGRILEPSLGSGNFFGLMPNNVRTYSQLYGVELDVLTSRIAKHLYPNAKIAAATGFQDYNAPNGYFDLVIGNPPFGDQPIYDTDKTAYSGASIHNYFLAKSIDKLRDGGVMAVVVSNSFMDANHSKTREWIAKRANLIGAMRLPNDAFKENAGTEVVTDVLFFQKTAEPEENPSWLVSNDIALENSKTGESHTQQVNQYYLDNPQNILGEQASEGTMYRGDSYTVKSNGDIAKQIDQFIKGLPQDIYTESTQPIEELDSADHVVPGGVKVGTYYADEQGNIRQRTPDVMGEARSIEWIAPNDAAINRMRGMMQLRDTLRKQMRLERDGAKSKTAIEKNRKALNEQYDSFVKEFGMLNRSVNRRLFIDDTEAALLQALEFDYEPAISKLVAKRDGIDPAPEKSTKADIFKRRVLFPPQTEINVTTATDALYASLDTKGRVDLDYMAEAYNKPISTIVSELGDVVYNDPQAGYVLADEYLSGDVKTKLEEAQAAANTDRQYQRNVEALKKVIPADKLPSEIFASVGANWIPKDVYQDFASLITGAPTSAINLQYIRAMASWSTSITGSGDAGLMTSDYGTEKLNAFALFDLMLNGKSPIVKYRVKNADGSTSTHTDVKATELAKAKFQRIREKWDSWLYDDPQRADRLATIFNEKHNRIVGRQFDGSHLKLHGSNPAIILRQHQKDVVWRGIQDRRVLYDHVVGAGKTFAAVATVMEFRRLGIARKPLLVVPNHLTLQWRSDFTKLYPSSNVLAATPEDFTKENRKRLFAKMVTGDYDAIIIGHSSLKKVGLPPEIEQRMINEQLTEISNAIEEIKRERGDRGIIRDMEKIKQNIENKLKKLKEAGGKKDDVVYFDELGVDALMIDEMHEFKNLYFTTQMQRVSGLGNPSGSGKSFDLFMKVLFSQEVFGENAPLITATGTPVSNSLSEMFTMQRFMQYDEMKRNDLHLFDAWARQYGDIENVYEVAPSGVGYRQSTRFSKFKNLPSLMASYRSFADVITLQDLKDQTAKQTDEKTGKPKVFPVPKMKTGKPINIVADRSELQSKYFGVPELLTDDAGNIQFEVNPAEAKIEENKEGKFVLSGGGANGSFDTREEAELELVVKALSPKTTIDKNSILGQFANLKELTKQTNGKINALSLTGLANKAGLDYRLIDPAAPDNPSSKINLAIDKMVEEYQATSKDNGTQLVFLDSSIPISAQNSLMSKERRVFVRDAKGEVIHKQGTVFKSADYNAFPVYLVNKGKGESKTVEVYEPMSGLLIDTPALKDKAEAKKWASEYVANESNRFRMLDMRDKSLMDSDAINEYRDLKELEVTDDNEITRDDLENMASDSRFSVYDDMKAKLMNKGIPEKEIAFIHDYNTPKKKEALFKLVNKGKVRFLFGSTPKLGAGTNVQERLVALHHIDAPWRPSDLEQREGRIIRQKNKLYARDPEGFEVGIYRYATEQTYDTRRWQLLEHKASGVEQLRNYTGEAEIEDITAEAANSADMKAAASGNPLILEETQLRTDIKRLQSLQKGHADSKYSMNRKIKENTRWVNEFYPTRKKQVQEVIATAKKHPLPEDSKKVASMVVNGKKMADREAALEHISNLANKVRATFADGDRATVTYRGIDFTFERSAFGGAGTIRVDAPYDRIHNYGVSDSFSASGLITRLNNWIDAQDGRVASLDAYAQEARQESESLAKRLNDPFEQEAELKEKQAQHADVKRRLLQSTQLEAVPESQINKFKALVNERKEEMRARGFEEAVKEYERDTPVFKRGASTNINDQVKTAVQAYVDKIAQGWKQAPDIIVVRDMGDNAIPEAVRVENERQLSQGAEGAPEGFHYRGKVYIVASQMNNAKDVERVLFHETLGHFGLRGLYGDSLKSILKQIANVRRNEVAAKAKEYGLKLDNERDRLIAAEEVLAEMAQTRPELGWVKKAIAAIRTWLRNNVPYFKNMKMTDSEIINNFILPARQYVENGVNSSSQGGLVPAFSRGDMPDTITVNGKKRPTSNSEGKPIADSIEKIESFYKWFGDSKVVDDQGRPLVVYHGGHFEASAFTAFDEALLDPENDMGAGFYFTDSRVDAEGYDYNLDFDTPQVLEVYLSTKKPFTIGESPFPKGVSEKSGEVFRQVIQDLGYDAIIDTEVSTKFASEGYTANGASKHFVMFKPDQIKSATGNNGDFSLDNDSVMFSRAAQADMHDYLNQNTVKSGLLDEVLGTVKASSAKEFGFLKNFRTQFDKAQQDPNGFGRMFRAAQQFELDANLTAARPAEAAPNLLSGDAEGLSESLDKIRNGDGSQKDKQAVATFLFDGTLAGDSVLDGKVYTEGELRAKGANDAQIKLYKEARGAIDQSLSEMAAGLAFNMVRKYAPTLKKEIISNPNKAQETIVDALREQYQPMLDAIKAEKKLDNPDQDKLNQLNEDSQVLIDLAGSVGNVFEHVSTLKKAGYAPLSRFGKYSLTAYDRDGNVAEFYRFETEFEAKRKERQLNKNTDYRVERGVMPTAPNTIFAGADPETVALFVDHLEGEGFDVDKAFMQEWYKTALGDRSAMKRMIERKGTKGFDEDIERVLSSFITSNSRFAASNYNRANMLEVLEFLRSDPEYKRKGDVFDEAKGLYDYVTEPKDPFTVGRSLMFGWFMGGSVASAAVNLTQPFTMTLPHLMRFTNPMKAGKAITAAVKQAGAIVFGKQSIRGELGDMLKLAKEQGIVDPQETYHLYRMGSGSALNRFNASKDLRTRMSGISSLWGMMFSRAESLNRYITFIAAYNIAKESGQADVFNFAKTAVEETQGIYSKANRVNWARGTGSLGSVGAMAFTFKQFSIAYVEMLYRNLFKNGKAGRRAAYAQLAILWLLSGVAGLPFADDGEDLLDTAIQFGGGEGNTRKWLQDTMLSVLGEDLGMLALYGVSSFMPFDIQGRMGMGNLIPSTDLFMPSNQNYRASSALEVLGAGGSFFAEASEAVQGLEQGKSVADIAKQFAPIAVKNIFKATDMLNDGFYSDTRGRRVIDTSPMDALFKGIGFQPENVAQSQKYLFNAQRSISRVRQIESSIAALMAQARFDKDQAAYQEAVSMLKEWNNSHPDLPIKITPRQISSRVKQMRMSKEERALKMTPRELRAMI